MKIESFTLEERIQTECFIWHWNTYPQERGLLHANNNNSENAIKGNKNKAMGVVAGVADMEYCKNGKTYFIEFKRPGQSQSSKQVVFEELVKAEGFCYELITSFDEFVSLIKKIRNES